MRSYLGGDFGDNLLLNIIYQVPPLVSEQLLHGSKVYTTHSSRVQGAQGSAITGIGGGGVS